MITIRCPQCQRKLNLPEEQRESLVRCPACQLTFLPFAQPGPIQETRTASAGPLEPIPSRQPTERTPSEEQLTGPALAIYQALGRASWWLRAAAGLTGLSAVCCCSASILELERHPVTQLEIALIPLAGGPGLSLLSASVFLVAAQSMRRWRPHQDYRMPSSRGWYTAATYLAVVEIIKQIAFVALGLIIALEGSPDPPERFLVCWTVVAAGLSLASLFAALVFTVLVRRDLERTPFL